MIRWRFILSRLMVVVATIVLLSWGLGPVAQYVTTSGLQLMTGAKVEIDQTTVGLFPPRLLYRGVRIADPRDGREMRDAVTADSIELVIDGQALLHRRFVARDGRISGLNIGSRRTISGHFDPEAERDAAGDEPSMLVRLLGAATDRATERAEAMVTDLEMVRRGEQIRRRWEIEYAELNARARDLEKQIRDVRDRARGIDNPLRDWSEFERTLAEARDARSELIRVHQQLSRLPERLQADLIRIDEAKQIDLARIDTLVPNEVTQNSDLGVDMLTNMVRHQISQVHAFLDGARELAHYTLAEPETSRLRGTDVDLNRVHRPTLLVKRCEVNGAMRSAGESYEMSGVVENVTATPEILVEPMRTRLRLEGPQTVRVEYVRDRRRGADTDLLTVHWPGSTAESVRLGDPQQASLAIDGGQRELWVQLETSGDTVSGRLVSKQTGVSLDLDVHSKYQESAAVESLRESLALVDRIEIDAAFAGHWHDMNVTLNTNLGQILRRASRDAVADQIRQTRLAMTAKIDQVHSQQTVELRRWLAEQQSEATVLLTSADQTIEEMSAKVLAEAGDADRYIGRLRGAVQDSLR